MEAQVAEKIATSVAEDLNEPTEVSDVEEATETVEEPTMEHEEEQMATTTDEEDDIITKMSQKMVDLALWEKPVMSGGILAAGTTMFSTITYFDANMLTVAMYMVTTALAAGMLYTGLQKARGLNGHITFVSETNAIAPKTVESIINFVVSLTNQEAKVWNSILSLEHIPTSISALVAAYFSTYITANMSALTIMFMMMLSFFSIPIAYKKNQDQVDEQMAKAYDMAEEYFKMALDKLPKAKKD
eukprot:TRINITY_DN1861_c0_g1_i2.p1 TRINITY_DN1861_c0_g1~~TRINITY_DN1861_c0_g1_i2.p1  ORF type:complete len:244 (-),score=119.81 TRINITY_DN1861_c0_g1_i2:42-773(-)